VAADDEVQQGAVGEHAGEAADRFWGGREEGAHRSWPSLEMRADDRATDNGRPEERQRAPVVGSWSRGVIERRSWQRWRGQAVVGNSGRQ
jgi:hypothetical protein